MADPSDMVPYNDPYDESQEFLNFMVEDGPTLEDISAIPPLGPTSSSNPPLMIQSNEQISAPSEPLQDPVTWGWGNNQSDHNPRAGFQPGPSGESSSREPGPQMNNTESHNTNNPSYYSVDTIVLPIWPVQVPLPLGCSCCQVLREINYSNGMNIKRLEIHGRQGIISHAVYEKRPNVTGDSSQSQYEMFDFCKNSAEEVKQFIIQFCLNQFLNGYVMVPDPLSIFYETLCVGIMDWNENQNPATFFQSPTVDPASGNQTVPEMQSQQEPDQSAPRTSLAEQRKRTGKMTVEDFRDYLHLPINEASRRMSMCPTVVKKICRRDGLIRWPYRKIRSYQKKMEELRESTTNGDEESRARLEAEVQRLRRELIDLYPGLNMEQ